MSACSDSLSIDCLQRSLVLSFLLNKSSAGDVVLVSMGVFRYSSKDKYKFFLLS